MLALAEFLDWCTILWKKRQCEVAGVVDGGRRKINLFAGLRLLAVGLKLVEACRWYLDTIDDERTLIAVDEVDAYLGLTENFLVVRR